MPTLTLLGPQRTAPNIEAALEEAGLSGPLVSITAGWRDAEGEISELSRAVRRPVTDLRLYGRAEEIFAEDPDLVAAHRERQARLRELQHLYRIRLRYAVDAVRELDRHTGGSLVLKDQQRAALSQLRLVDRQHNRQVRAIHQAYEARCEPSARTTVRAHRAELAGLVTDAQAVLIAGGHVAVLLNRMRLFGLDELLQHTDLIAWSAGAMCLAPQVVLFHDHAPEGRRDPEIMDLGLGLAAGTLPLPDASHRLRLDDHAMLRVFARRFAPAACLTLDRGSLIRWSDGRLNAAAGVSRLTRGGRVRRVRVS